MSSITVDGHDHGGHAPWGWQCWRVYLDLRFLSRSQDHWTAVPVFHVALVPRRRLAGAGDSLAVGLAVAGHAGDRHDAVLGRRWADFARVLHDAVHDACHGDDFLRDHSDPGRCLWQLSDSAHDRRGRHGLPDAEHAQLLVHVAGLYFDRHELLQRPAMVRRPAGLPILRCRRSGRRRLEADPPRRCGCWASPSSASRR